LRTLNLEAMRRYPLIRWLTLWGLLALAALPAPDRSRAPGGLVPEAVDSAVLAAPASQPPSPFLATSGLILELPALEPGWSAPHARATSPTADPGGARGRASGAARSRIRVLALRHDTFAADNLAARAGLLSARTTAPPPPLV
jgi:hypothetical protein